MQSHSTSNPTSFAQKGALAALKGDQSFIGIMVKAFAERRAFILLEILSKPVSMQIDTGRLRKAG